MAMYGIDVAKWQGTIDWMKVKAAGKQFAILKVTQKNNTVEGSFEKNYAGCIQNNIPIGVYRYVYAKTADAAKAEANAMVSVLKGRTIKCGVWLDMEDASIRSIGKSNLSNIIKIEADILKKAGYSVGIYCNKDWYNSVLYGAELAKTYPFWIARYPSNDTGIVKDSISPASYAKVWQYSSKGKVAGISGNVDMNMAFVDLIQLMNGNKASVSYYPRYTGTTDSIAKALQAIGVDGSYSFRKKIAVANGISNYSGTAVQNISMLNLLKDGKLIKA